LGRNSERSLTGDGQIPGGLSLAKKNQRQNRFMGRSSRIRVELGQGKTDNERKRCVEKSQFKKSPTFQPKKGEDLLNEVVFKRGGRGGNRHVSPARSPARKGCFPVTSRKKMKKT